MKTNGKKFVQLNDDESTCLDISMIIYVATNFCYLQGRYSERYHSMCLDFSFTVTYLNQVEKNFYYSTNSYSAEDVATDDPKAILAAHKAFCEDYEMLLKLLLSYEG